MVLEVAHKRSAMANSCSMQVAQCCTRGGVTRKQKDKATDSPGPSSAPTDEIEEDDRQKADEQTTVRFRIRHRKDSF